MKTWTKRKLTYHGDIAVEVSISIYGHGNLMPCELKNAGDNMADRVMIAMSETRSVRAPLSRIKVQRNAK